MNSVSQIILIIIKIQCLQLLVTSTPIFKGLTFKKNFEVEISAIPFKHISFIKEKWFPFKLISVKHDIAKREVEENPKVEHSYSVNEVLLDDEDSEKLPGLLTSVTQNLDLNSDGEIFEKPAPVVDKVDSVVVSPMIEPSNLATGIMHTSSVMPINPNIIFAPSIQTAGSIVQPAAVPSHAEGAISPIPKETQPPLSDETSPIQPLHTHVDIPSLEKLEESVSKMHTDISSSVVKTPVKETDLTSLVGTAAEPPKIVGEIKVEPAVEPPVISPAEPPTIIPVLQPPAFEIPVKTGPPGLLMRGTRFVLYFGSVMLQVLSQMLSGSPPNLNRVAEPLTLI